MKRKLSVLIVVTLLAGCNPFASTLEKQGNACADDVKLGLGDPGSLEVMSSEGIPLDNGGFRLKLSFTAKNAMGGRVRGEALCGFKSKDTTDLNADDIVNQTRKLRREMKSLGM